MSTVNNDTVRNCKRKVYIPTCLMCLMMTPAKGHWCNLFSCGFWSNGLSDDRCVFVRAVGTDFVSQTCRVGLCEPELWVGLGESELWGRTVWVRAVGSDCVGRSCRVGLCESELWGRTV